MLSPKSNLLQRYNHVVSATEGFKGQLEDRTKLVEDVLAKVVIETIRKYQQRVNVGIQDSIVDLLSTFKLKVAEEIFAHITDDERNILLSSLENVCAIFGKSFEEHMHLDKKE